MIGLNLILKSSKRFENEKNPDNNNKPYKIENIMEVNALRINKLFDILFEKEKLYKSVLSSLNVLLFENLVNEKEDVALMDFANEAELFLKVVDKRVTVTNEFIDYLTNMSNYYTYKNPRDKIEKYTVIEVINFILW